MFNTMIEILDAQSRAAGKLEMCKNSDYGVAAKVYRDVMVEVVKETQDELEELYPEFF